jgi:hypothetical protein|tara:strand:+ start:957 stop:1193 length:237 start_codon:yes stop_codon:yes gene_type:complete
MIYVAQMVYTDIENHHSILVGAFSSKKLAKEACDIELMRNPKYQSCIHSFELDAPGSQQQQDAKLRPEMIVHTKQTMI